MNYRWVGLAIILVTLAGCVGPAPIEDYTLASTALNAARASKAARFAPGFLSQAEDYYRQAQLDYEERRYDQARENFTRARQFAEKSENYTVLKKAETGDSE